jgi:hypothetical protein
MKQPAQAIGGAECDTLPRNRNNLRRERKFEPAIVACRSVTTWKKITASRRSKGFHIVPI